MLRCVTFVRYSCCYLVCLCVSYLVWVGLIDGFVGWFVLASICLCYVVLFVFVSAYVCFVGWFVVVVILLLWFAAFCVVLFKPLLCASLLFCV